MAKTLIATPNAASNKTLTPVTISTGTYPGADTFPAGGVPIALTVSGNEITDALRALRVQGDGLLNDSSSGIWQASTNLHTQGGYETNGAGVSAETGSCLVVGRTAAGGSKFGTYACEIDSQGAGGLVQATLFQRDGSRTPVNNGNVYTASVWAWMFSGSRTANIRIVWYDAANAQVGSVNTGSNLTLGAGVENAVRLTVTATAPATAVTGRLQISFNSTVAGDRFFIDGVQFEAGSIATPYIHTDGLSATRSPGRVRVPASLLDETQGWVAMRVRVGWSATADLYGGGRIFAWSWRDDANNALDLGYDPTSDVWRSRRSILAGGDQAASALQTFVAGDVLTLVMAWTATTLSVSVNGGAFATIAATRIPTLAATTIDIGDRQDNTSQQLDGDVLWFACGAGVLTDVNAATIHSFGNSDPVASAFPNAALLTGLWHADDANLETSLDKTYPGRGNDLPPQPVAPTNLTLAVA